MGGVQDASLAHLTRSELTVLSNTNASASPPSLTALPRQTVGHHLCPGLIEECFQLTFLL
ncbi:hypothetical protein TSMEX_004759 [Taenia solium]|eukprot:TsM_000374100 transcript=TsM_000374100 gene=TsM_000374100